MRNVCRLAFLAVLWLIPIAPAQTTPVQSYSERDASGIYRIVLSAVTKKSALVVTTTVNPVLCVPAHRDMSDDEFRAALSDFRNVNQQKWDIGNFLDSKRAISRSEIDSLFKEGILEGWKQLRLKYPDHPFYQAVSAVGFDPHHSVAIVYSEVRCGPKCGTGEFRYFLRRRGRWSELTKGVPSCSWIS